MTTLTAREFVDSFLITIVSRHKATERKLIDKIMEVAKSKISPDGRMYEVSLSVNGVELDFNEYVDRVNECLEDMVVSAAKEIFDENIRDLNESLHDLQERAKDSLIERRTSMHALSQEIITRIDELRASRPYDGRRVTLHENRGGWRFEGLTGTCTRFAVDGNTMVLCVEYDPEDYWPVGMELLVELDNETSARFWESV